MRRHLLLLLIACGAILIAQPQAQRAAQTPPAGTPADWLTDGGDPQRTNWQRHETILTKDNVRNLKLLWKLKLDNKPRAMTALLPPVIVGRMTTTRGAEQIAIVGGVSDNLFAINVDQGELLWRTHFDSAGTNPQEGGILCPGGLTDTPVIGPADASGRRIA